MTNYLIELSIIHMVLISGYWIFLRKEREYHKMRFYLLGATLLALTIPLLKLPKLFVTQEAPLLAEVTLGTVSFSPTPVVTNQWYLEVIFWVYVIISAFFLARLIRNLFHMLRLKRDSQFEEFNNVGIHKVPNIKGSFTFFHWIFLSENIRENHQEYAAILKHEKAHAALGHTYDLLFMEMFKVCFWWLPTTWFINKEIKKIHEYQADHYALKSCSVDQYSSILISATLKTNGLSLASSFHDGLILKRLIAMKKQAKDVSPWKFGVLAGLCALLIVIFACSEELDNKSIDLDSPANVEGGDVFKVVEQQPEFEGGIEAFYKYIGSEMRYPLKARQMGIEGKVEVQFVIEKDGSISNVQAMKGIGAGCDQEAVRVVQNAASFKPGMQQGKPVRVLMTLPVVFKLNHEKTNPDQSTQGMIILDEVSSDNLTMQVKANYDQGIWNGVVLDEQGNGLPGANIIVEGTHTGTISDRDGSFYVETDDPNDLIVSFVGYNSARLKASN